jgi:hypothetical protein
MTASVSRNTGATEFDASGFRRYVRIIETREAAWSEGVKVVGKDGSVTLSVGTMSGDRPETGHSGVITMTCAEAIRLAQIIMAIARADEPGA